MQIGAIARLRAGATLERANAELAALERRLASEYPQANTGRTLEAIPLRDTIVGTRTPHARPARRGRRRGAAHRVRKPREPAPRAFAGARA